MNPCRVDGGGRGRPKKPVLEQAALVAWIAQSIPKWAPSLEALLRISGEAPLERAAIAIRTKELSALSDALRQGLKQRDPGLGPQPAAVQPPVVDCHPHSVADRDLAKRDAPHDLRLAGRMERKLARQRVAR